MTDFEKGSFKQRVSDEIRYSGAIRNMKATEVCLEVADVLLALLEEAFPEPALQNAIKSQLLLVRAEERGERRQQPLNEQEEHQDG